MILYPGDVALDYSSARPKPRLIFDLGVRLVVRYISPTRANRKNATASEIEILHDNGLAVALVWEDRATDALGGDDMGRTFAPLAESFARDLGYPLDQTLYVAVDCDVTAATMPLVLAYLSAFAANCVYPIAPYGEADTIDAAAGAGIVTAGWQSRAWSHGRLSPYADVLQEIGFAKYPALAVLGNVDVNTVYRSFTAWSHDPPQLPGEEDMASKWVLKAGTGEVWEVVHDAGRTWTFHVGGPDDPGARNELLSGLFYDPATLPQWDAAALDNAPHAPLSTAGDVPRHTHLGPLTGPTGDVIR